MKLDRKNKPAVKPVDRAVGARVRFRRMELGMSQEKLADAIGLTFQQVQKYEKGTNRIGSSRLVQIATALQVQPGYFFQGSEVDATTDSKLGDAQAFLGTREGVEIVTLFPSMSKRAQTIVLLLIKNLAGKEDVGDGPLP